MNWIIIGVVLIGGLVYLAISRKQAASAAVAAGVPAAEGAGVLEAGNVVGRTAPNWTLKDPNGKTVSLSQFAGHPVVMDFWATWCGPCKIEMPWWEELQDKYRAQGLVIIGISEDAKLSDVQSFLATNPMNYRIVWDDQSLDNGGYGTPFGTPTTLFVNRQGKITDRVVGLESKSDLEKAVEAIL